MGHPSRDDTKARWALKFQPLVGRTITAIRYLDDKEVEHLAWNDAAIVIQLDDGTIFWPSKDDEGNDAGALFLVPSVEAKRRGVEETAPVI